MSEGQADKEWLMAEVKVNLLTEGLGGLIGDKSFSAIWAMAGPL